jgi:hypothetical protein
MANLASFVSSVDFIEIDLNPEYDYVSSSSSLLGLSLNYPHLKTLPQGFARSAEQSRPFYEIFLLQNLRWIALLFHLSLVVVHVILVSILPYRFEHRLTFRTERQNVVSTMITITLQAFAIVSASTPL